MTLVKKKIMIINSHLVKWTKYIGKEMNNIDFDIIHTIRNPLSAVSSPVNNWLRYEDGKHFFAKSICGCWIYSPYTIT